MAADVIFKLVGVFEHEAAELDRALEHPALVVRLQWQWSRLLVPSIVPEVALVPGVRGGGARQAGGEVGRDLLLGVKTPAAAAAEEASIWSFDPTDVD